MTEETQFNYIQPIMESGANDLSFDWYGNRLATVNDNRRINIFLKSKSGWTKETEFDSKHEGPIWKMKWAHPNFGNLIATSLLIRLVRRIDLHLEGIGHR